MMINPNTVALCTPTYDGKLDVLYTLGQAECVAKGLLRFDAIRYEAGCSNVALARNRCVHWFLKTPFQHLVFVDADIGFRASDWAALLEDDGSECVCAPYRKKDQRQAVKVHMGLGFARISRPVFACLAAQDNGEGRELLSRFRMDGEEWIDYFPQGVGIDGCWRGEDHGFWLLAKVAGAQVRIEERARLVHTGIAHWVYRAEDFPNPESAFGVPAEGPDAGFIAPPAGIFPDEFQGF